MQELDDSTKKRLSFFDNNYFDLEIIHLNNDEKIYLGNSENRICRFCNKRDGDTTFKNEAHALPELIGNKKLIALYECDACNNKFSGLLESSFSNYMNLWHTLAQVRGKGGVPTFKPNSKKNRIDLGVKAIEIKDFVDDSIVTLDEEHKSFIITSTRHSYVPIAVYKCLTKMALTIMPEAELGYFDTTMKWINETSHSESSYKHRDLKVMFSFAPGIHPFPFITAGLFKRKQNHADHVPYMIFVLAYANFVFQIYLPFCDEDAKLDGLEGKMQFLPTPIDMTTGSNTLIRQIIDCGGTEKVKNQKISITMKYDTLIETDLTNSENDSPIV